MMVGQSGSKINPPFTLALVTGASSGIGAACCRLLARQGIPLLLTGRDSQRLNALADELKAIVPVKTLIADLADADARARLIAMIYAHTPDLMINNAGFGLYGDALTYDTKMQMEIVDVNAAAVLELTLESARALLSKDKKGTILNVSSAADMLIFPRLAVYAASKAFVSQLSQSLDYEFRPHGIRVLVACPGQVATAFSKRASADPVRAMNRFSMSAEFAAEQLWKQISNGKARHVFDWKTKLGAIFLRFFLPSRAMAYLLSNNLGNPRLLIRK